LNLTQTILFLKLEIPNFEKIFSYYQKQSFRNEIFDIVNKIEFFKVKKEAIYSGFAI